MDIIIHTFDLADVLESIADGNFDEITIQSLESSTKKIQFPSETLNISTDSRKSVYRRIEDSSIYIREAKDDAGYYCGYAGCLSTQATRKILPPEHPGIPTRVEYDKGVSRIYLCGHFCSWECVAAYLEYAPLGPHVHQLELLRNLDLYPEKIPAPQEVTLTYPGSLNTQTQIRKRPDHVVYRECRTFSAIL